MWATSGCRISAPDSPWLSERDLETEFDLPAAPKLPPGEPWNGVYPNVELNMVRIGVVPVQPVGGIVSSHLQLGGNSFGDAHRLGEIRIQIPEMRTVNNRTANGLVRSTYVPLKVWLQAHPP